ncbi:MAG: hypothetical protein ABSF29_04505 [Tepidisphaeraceae bacterium]|jgi:hypothetical protein
MSQLSVITLNPSSDLVGLPERPRRPKPGEITGKQAAGGGLPGFSAAALAPFSAAATGTYETYRRISAHPTNALVRSIVAAPIIANTWRWKKLRDDVPDGWVDLARQVLDPLRQSIVRDALRALEFGWAGFEKVWDVQGGRRILRKLKPLLWEFTEILVDEHGNPAGLLNRAPGGKPTVLAGGKFFLYTTDAEAGNPYGRSRHENIRQVWSECEQIRQRLAQYLRKVSGIVVQLHYPEGTSRDSAGAERPNQWLGQQVLDAVSAGKSVMFPNGFAAVNDPQAAFDLAGKSPWQLSAFESAGADHAPGMKAVLEYYDALIFRGWMRPERSGLESRYGNRADAKTHTDTATLDSELIDRDLADAINHDVVDELLVFNFGPSARSAVAIEPAPIETDSVEALRKILGELLANKTTDAASKIDVDALLDQLSVPRGA